MADARIEGRVLLRARGLRAPLARILRCCSGDLIVSQSDAGISLTVDGVDVPLSAEVRVHVQRRLLWSTLHVVLPDSRRFTVRGLRTRLARALARHITGFAITSEAQRLLRAFSETESGARYMGFAAFDRWREQAVPLRQRLLPREERVSLALPLAEEVVRLAAIVDVGEAARIERNNRFVEKEQQRLGATLGQSSGYSLNEDQLQAVLHDEDRALVVAGAGTGKTSTIVGKVEYLLSAGLAKPDDILLMAFTRKAAEEMRERLARVTGADVAVLTFHALGLRIHAESHGRKPSLSRLAEDDRALLAALGGFVDSLIDDPVSRGSAIEFLSFFRYPLRPEETFRSTHERHQYAKGHDLRDLRGTQMKSVQETMIANWMLLNGIEYEYERDYEHLTASVRHRQYRPDFYLPQYGIYIEHFGVDRNGNPPPFFSDGAKYLEGMQWKRQLHQRNRTTLVETFSYQAFDRTLFVSLEAALRSHGVELRPIPPAAATALVRNQQVMQPFLELVRSFLKLFKGNAWTMDLVRKRVKEVNDLRAEKFVEVFAHIYRKYQATLAAEPAIDFDDMIVEAAELVELRSWKSRFTYVLVDEFQDISAGRAKLLRALLDQIPESRLFCVGDDWQSIYRFTGSDIELMTGFEAHFGRFRRTDLRQTHRFGSRLLEATSKFVTENPQQLGKQLSAAYLDDAAAVEVHSTSGSQDEPIDLSEVFRRIQLDAASRQTRRAGPVDVLLLGRYNFVGDRRRVYHDAPGISVRFLTAHSAKGLEADYAVVLDVVGGRYGFPTEIVDDPLLELVLAKRPPFPNAEERRLFYVAMTRARRRTYLITHDSRRSIFIDELEATKYAGLVVPSGAAQRVATCRSCDGGRLERRSGEHGQFFGCSNYPLCRGKATSCPRCGQGAFVKVGGQFACHGQGCDERRSCCPSCREGYLRIKSGPHGDFFGCSEWRQDPRQGTCGYTRKC